MNNGPAPMATYQFATIRYTNSAISGEFVNIGVALWVPQDRALLFRLDDSVRRLALFFAGFDAQSYLVALRALRARLEGWRELSPSPEDPPSVCCSCGRRASLTNLSLSPEADVFSAVLRDDATCFGWGSVGFGITTNPARRCEQLFDEFVTRHKLNSRPSPVTVGADIPWVYRHVIEMLRQAIAAPVDCPWWVLRADEGDGTLMLSKKGAARIATEKDRAEINAVASELWETNPLIRELLLPHLSGTP